MGDDDAVEELLSSNGSQAVYVQIFENGLADESLPDCGGGNIEREQLQVYESQVRPCLINITGAMMWILIGVITPNLRKARALQVMIVRIVMTTA